MVKGKKVSRQAGKSKKVKKSYSAAPKAPKFKRPKLKLKLKARKGFSARAAPKRKGKWKGLSLLGNSGLRQKLIDMAGENTLNVIKEFSKEMSDEEIARRTKIKVSEVRAVLNKMHSAGLVRYTRNRDKDSGWYSYLWSLNMDKMEALAPGEGSEASGFETASMSDGGEYYICKACSPTKAIPFEKASDSLFKCESCGTALEFLEQQKKKQ